MHTNKQPVRYLHLNLCYQLIELNHFTIVDSHSTKTVKIKKTLLNDTLLIANACLDTAFRNTAVSTAGKQDPPKLESCFPNPHSCNINVQ